jgi:ketosteroid isomerase-like protein
MSEQQNLDIVRETYAAFGRGDIAGIVSLLDEAVEWIAPGPPELPTAGYRKGPEAIMDFFKTLAGIVDIQRFDAREFFAQGDRVVVLGDDVTRVKATGKVLEFAWAHSFTLRGGKIVRFEEFFDVTMLVAELQKAKAGV